jgi:hypothetical protein
MAWILIDEKMGSSAKELTGDPRARSEVNDGFFGSTFRLGVALARLLSSLASQTRQFCSGCESTKLKPGQYQRQENSSIGACLDLTTRCGIDAENLTLDGLVVSRQSANRFIAAKSGSLRVALCGSEIRRLANGAVCVSVIRRTCRFIFTTSSRLLLLNCVQMPTTLSCSAKCATTSYTHGGM